MNILMANYSEVTSPGGVHKTITEVAKRLSRKGHNVTVFQANPMNLSAEEVYEGFKIIRVKSNFGDKLYGFHPEFISFLKKYYKNLNPDIIHVHGYHTLFSPELIFLFKKIYPNTPLFFSPHFGTSSHDTFGGKYLWSPYNKLIGNRVVEIPTLIIAASKFEAKNIHNILGVPKEKIKIIPHGVDLIEVNTNFKIKKESINILYVGYLIELKGVQYIIQAISELISQTNIKVKLIIVGKGPYEKNLKKLADKLNVSKNIDWKGFMSSSDLINEYKKADVFVLPSKSENYGISVSEALALGTPSIVTKTTALNEFLNEPGCFGIECPAKPSKISDLILEIISKDVKVGPFSKKIRTWERVTFDYENIYKDNF